MADSVVAPARTDRERVKRAVATLIHSRVTRFHAYMMIEAEIESEADISRDIEDQLLVNSFTIAAVIAESLPCVRRMAWAFEMNERWFEDTLPNLSDFHFRRAFRVSPSTFRFLVESLACVLNLSNTNMRQSISVEKRVAIGLYRLCSSAEDRTIAHLFAVGRSTVNLMWRQFCAAVIEQLEGQWLCMVRRDQMDDHVREFFAVTEFPQAVGALDGCHFAISPPKEHAADYYNYKGWYSIILLALVDHRYRFRYIRVGSPGRCHDASVYAGSGLKEIVESAHFMSPQAIIEDTRVAPVILCDQAFPLTEHLMKPFANPRDGTAERVFNYNLSRTRRIVENAFGRMKARFRFVAKRIECRLPNSKRAIRAACTLHNICEDFRDNVEQAWEQEAQQLSTLYMQPSHNTQD
ncbi:uncharacterized protein LOC119450898 [Dermacentor silvarum]|uniref:uncharacterized protein LOC119450898 n=1 Tax=Dermacentor silvarum TaxID=543639 RepID=UPI0021015851|nr:uncharacterized protein LOC119450898 [Dermacentor silvarum]